MSERRKPALSTRGLAIVLMLITTMTILPIVANIGNSQNQQNVTTVDLQPKVSKTAPVTLPQLKWNYTIGLPYFQASCPAVGDLNNDGKLEVVVGTEQGYVYCLNSTGALKWRFNAVYPLYSPTIADVDGDGRLEVLIESCHGEVYCLNGAGGLKWEFSTGQSSNSWVYWFRDCAPVVKDIDGDGKNEVVAAMGSWDNRIYCLNSIGSVKWSYEANAFVCGIPAVADLYGDGQQEIVIGSDHTNVYCLNKTGGAKWIFAASNYFGGSPVITDVDGDGQQEVVIGSDSMGWVHDSLFCLNKTGGLKWSCPILWDSSDPVVTDIDEDMRQEIVVGGGNGSFSGLYCFNGTGSVKWSSPYGATAPTISDIFSNGQNEILFGSGDGREYCLDSKGELMWSFSTGYAIHHRSTVSDIDGDGKKEILVAGSSGQLYCLNAAFASTLVLQVADYPSSDPILGATIVSTSQPSGQTQLTGFTNSTGFVTFAGLMPGKYNISVSNYRYVNRTLTLSLVAGGASSQTVSLHRTTGEIYVRVIDYGTGDQISGASVVSMSQPQGQSKLSAFTNATGYAKFSNVLAGNYTIEIHKDGYNDQQANLTVMAEQTLSQGFSMIVLSQPGGTSMPDYALLAIAVIAITVPLAALALAFFSERKSVSPRNRRRM